jgi:hypothetical protein
MSSATPIAVNTTLALRHQPPHCCRRSTDGHAKSDKHGDGDRHLALSRSADADRCSRSSSVMISSAYSRPQVADGPPNGVRNERGISGRCYLNRWVGTECALLQGRAIDDRRSERAQIPERHVADQLKITLKGDAAEMLSAAETGRGADQRYLQRGLQNIPKVSPYVGA